MDLKKVLVEKLKDKGMDIAEDAAKDVIEAVFETAEEVVKETENKYDDLLMAAFPAAKAALLELADKIDGEEG
jgi:TRAP-type C4-dicarboxylate transport system substrate-binding protein